MTNQATSIADESDTDLFYFMNSWVVASDIASDGEATLEFEFTGTNVDAEYLVLFTYGAPDSADASILVSSESSASESISTTSSSTSKSPRGVIV